MFLAIYRNSQWRYAWISFGLCPLNDFCLHHMPSPAIVPLADAPPLAGVRATSVRKALFWDRVARKYAADPIADLAGYETTLRRVQGLLSDKHEVLEIGCGTGSTALRLAPFVRHLMATDVSAAMIAIAREKLAAQPMPQLDFAVADADAPGFGQSAYDVALAFNLLHLVSDLDGTLALAVKALRPGGLFISKTPCIAEMNPLIPYLALPLMRAIGKAPHVLCFNGDGLQSAITRQGLEIVSVERHGTRGKDIRVFIVARKPA
ncbi:class I SAM-dependent methyltransferase [Polaromonas sp.]|uniref:class I SAM-dependent methyltransferase n=1 Tax=Polaromonas sp. TaxID=1869339 RepID=UPI003565DEB5